ncbi:hypothetical protein RJ641_011552 [Dillenia turbinata]|uniref:Uncharacterized protein n=1 Tax=Dillenia turbinata TaxID=194707 RepID=A0AAN8V8L9_9MAGN
MNEKQNHSPLPAELISTIPGGLPTKELQILAMKEVLVQEHPQMSRSESNITLLDLMSLWATHCSHSSCKYSKSEAKPRAILSPTPHGIIYLHKALSAKEDCKAWKKCEIYLLIEGFFFLPLATMADDGDVRIFLKTLKFEDLYAFLEVLEPISWEIEGERGGKSERVVRVSLDE